MLMNEPSKRHTRRKIMDESRVKLQKSQFPRNKTKFNTRSRLISESMIEPVVQLSERFTYDDVKLMRELLSDTHWYQSNS
jgi:hypothetical protein